MNYYEVSDRYVSHILWLSQSERLEMVNNLSGDMQVQHLI